MITANKKKFRINANNFFLTYSQCPLDPEEVLIFNPDEYLICQEHHQDGGLHLHSFVSFKIRKDIKNENYFDIKGYHPNVQKCRSVSCVIAYVAKGGRYITNMSQDKIRKAQGLTKTQILAENVLASGKITTELVKNNPELLFKNFDQIQKWLSVVAPYEDLPEAPAEKCRHYWVYGGSNTGKTVWLRKFIKSVPDQKTTEELPTNNDYSGFNCNTKLIWADEYRGGCTIQQLNRICDGNSKLNTKGGSTRIHYPLVIIVSNYSIVACYQNASENIQKTVFNRFNEYCSDNNDFPVESYDLYLDELHDL